jgi:hypothetical protein
VKTHPIDIEGYKAQIEHYKTQHQQLTSLSKDEEQPFGKRHDAAQRALSAIIAARALQDALKYIIH